MEKRDVVDKIIKLFKTRGGKAFKTDGNYKPDIFACYKGRCITIECKDTGKLKTVTEGQKIELENWGKAGAISFLSDHPDDVITILDHIDARVNEGEW